MRYSLPAQTLKREQNIKFWKQLIRAFSLNIRDFAAGFSYCVFNLHIIADWERLNVSLNTKNLLRYALA